MKKIGLLAVCAAMPLLGLLWGCKETPLPEYETIRVERVSFDEQLKAGVVLTEGNGMDLTERFTYAPAEATNTTVSYNSSDPFVATVDELGRITALLVGETTITVMIDTRSDSFTLTVVEPPVIEVESVAFTAAIGTEQTLAIGQTLMLSDKVTILPEDATNQNMSFDSSDPEVASVSNIGLVTGLKAGTTTITVTVDGKSASFELTVVRTVTLSISAVTVPVDATNRIWDKINVTPVPTDLKVKDVVFSSSDLSVATVDEYGVIIGVAPGNATVTVADKDNADVKATLPVKVVAVDYYPRNAAESAVTPWTMTSDPAPSSGSSLTAALDGIYGSTNSDVAANVLNLARTKINDGSGVTFTVDMQESKVVNVFKIIHRSGPNTNRLVRFFGFDEIAGSNDGTNFTPIATMVEVADAQSPVLLSISETTFANTTAYQYIRFTAKTASFCCIHGIVNYPGVSYLLNADRTPNTSYNPYTIQNHTDNQGGSNQIQELYLGAMLE